MALSTSKPLTALVVITISLAACEGGGPALNAIGPTAVPYFGAAWLDDGTRVVAYEPNSEDLKWQLFRLDDGGDLAQLDVEADRSCASTRFHRPTALPDGRLGFVQECVPVAAGPSAFDVMAYSEETGVESLGGLPTVASQMGWSPDMNDGLVSIGNGVCQTIALVKEGSLSPWELTIGEGETAFSLAAQFEAGFGDDCSTRGRADWPAWSRDGRLVAFFGSPESVGRSGQARLDAPWNLYLLEWGDSTPRVMLGGVTGPRALKWDPNGGRLVFSGQLDDGRRGTWLVDSENGEVELLSGTQLKWIDWSPEGRELIGVLDRDDGNAFPPHSDLVLLPAPPASGG